MNQTVEKCASLDDLEVLRESLAASTLLSWTLLNTFSIFSMQLGFALLETGTIHKRHHKSVLMKNLLDGSCGALAWYFVGYGLYSKSSDGANFAPSDVETFADFLLSYAFAVTTVTIVSGSVAARMKLYVYLGFASLLVCLLYPTVAAWVWSPTGWLNDKYVDFAGGVVVHGFGGVAGLVGAVLCGPRTDRFFIEPSGSVASDGRESMTGTRKINRMAPSSPTAQVTGTLMLWTAWFSFNGVSAGGLQGEARDHTIVACMNTLLSSSVAAVSGLFFSRIKDGYYDLSQSLNCLLAGLVAITASCAFVDGWAACFIGLVGVSVFLSLDSFLLHRLHIDDPLSASALHGGCGVVGGILTGVFHQERGLIAGETSLFVSQLYGTIAIVGFAAVTSTLLLGTAKLWLGQLHCSEDDQILGLDFKYHDGKHFEELTAAEVSQFTKQKAALQKEKAKRKKQVQPMSM